MSSPPRYDQPVALKYKPDWPQACGRWAAFWEGQPTDRPCIAVGAPRPGAKHVPLLAPTTMTDRYFDPDYVAAQWRRQLETTYFGGEAVPTGNVLMGMYALGCGPGVRFAEDTIWHPVTMRSIRGPLGWHPGQRDPWQTKMDRVLGRLLELAPGEFLVGHVCQVMANDLLPLLRGTEDFLVDLATDTDTCCRRLQEVLRLWWEQFDHFRGTVEARQSGCVWGWPGLWHPREVMVSQSDMSCMISRETFDRYVMADLDCTGERYDVVWYHLDGWGAVHHLPTLLSRPYIRVIQFVSTEGQPPNGPAFIDLYRRIQAAGRGLDISAPMENMEYLIRRLTPERLFLRTQADSIEQAEELLHNARKWCGTHVRAES
ncbi:MAG TPA: hypothetical protein VNA25_29500 [Phycisphaerae bacterium]|nr:hypothetical protein [Phycisphaerae bacterium]HUT61994.1 hypothetical protein [Phycisphaerae bacterium]